MHASVGQWFELSVAGSPKVAHAEVTTDDEGNPKWIVTVYKGDPDGSLLSAAYWRGESVVSLENAMEAVRWLIEGEWGGQLGTEAQDGQPALEAHNAGPALGEAEGGG